MEPASIDVGPQESRQKPAGDARLLADILQNIPAVAWTVKPDGRMDFINRFYLEVTGQSLTQWATGRGKKGVR